MSLDLVSIGDPTIDTFLKLHDAHLSCKLHHQDCQLCLDYANKIPVEDFFKFPAGNSINNAIGSARLGLKTAFYGMVGRDADGEWIKDELAKEGVDTSYLRYDDHRATNASTVIVFQKERTILVWHQIRPYALPALATVKWVYFTSSGPLSPYLEKLHREVNGYLRSHPAKLAFNPGTYQLLMGRSELKPLLERTELMFLNKEETQELVGKKTDDIKLLLKSLHQLGPQIVVVTDGPNGSYAYDGTTYWACGIYDMPIVERTGAGDAYATAFTAARFHGLAIPEAMRWGTFNSAYVVGQYGGVLGQLTKAKMDELSSNHPELKPKEF